MSMDIYPQISYLWSMLFLCNVLPFCFTMWQQQTSLIIAYSDDGSLLFGRWRVCQEYTTCIDGPWNTIFHCWPRTQYVLQPIPATCSVKMWVGSSCTCSGWWLEQEFQSSLWQWCGTIPKDVRTSHAQQLWCDDHTVINSSKKIWQVTLMFLPYLDL